MKLKQILIKILKIDIENPQRDILFIGLSIIGTLCDYGLFYILKESLGIRQWKANFISYPLGVIITFMLNYFIVYKNDSSSNGVYIGWENVGRKVKIPVLHLSVEFILKFSLVFFAHLFSAGLQALLMYKFSVIKLVTIIINGILMWFTRLFFDDKVIAKIVTFYHHLKHLLASDSWLVSISTDAFLQ